MDAESSVQLTNAPIPIITSVFLVKVFLAVIVAKPSTEHTTEVASHMFVFWNNNMSDSYASSLCHYI